MKPKHLIITLLAFFASIAASAFEWTDANGTVWSFTTSGSTASIYKDYTTTAISGTIPADLTIPTTLYVGETPYTVTSIGEYAFNNCSSLTSVNIPEDVTLTAHFRELPFTPVDPSDPESQGGNIQTLDTGDANGDGSVDVTDAVAVINAYLNGDSSSINVGVADVNHDNVIDITDAVAIINLYLNNQ